VSEPKRPSSFAAAVAGGVIGSLLTAALLIFAAPQWLSSRIVRQGMLADPQILADTADSLRDAQYAPTLAANRTTDRTTRRDHPAGPPGRACPPVRPATHRARCVGGVGRAASVLRPCEPHGGGRGQGRRSHRNRSHDGNRPWPTKAVPRRPATVRRALCERARERGPCAPRRRARRAAASGARRSRARRRCATLA